MYKDYYMRILGLQGYHSNVNNKIWFIWNSNFNITVVKDTDQHITCKISHYNTSNSFYLTTVYAKCRSSFRKELWEDMVDFSNSINEPWAILGDFNVITNVEEKIGGSPYRIEKSIDFINCLSDCGLQDAGS